MHPSCVHNLPAHLETVTRAAFGLMARIIAFLLLKVKYELQAKSVFCKFDNLNNVEFLNVGHAILILLSAVAAT